MTLQQFQQLTAGMPAHTEIKIMDLFGNFGPAAVITSEDICHDDPAREDFPHDCLVFVEDAELAIRKFPTA